MSRLRFWQTSSQASRWFERMRSGRIDARADEEFRRWLQHDAGNESASERRELVWNLAGELQGRSAFENMLREADTAGSATRTGTWFPLRLAAGLAVFLMAAMALWLGLRTSEPDPVEYVTAVGEQRTVELADQSSVTLNTNTRIVVRISQKTRRVELAQGEALFRVKPDAAVPFDVHTLEGRVRAVGTQFNVYLRESAEISVLEGIVDATTHLGTQTETTTRLVAGQAIEYDRSGVHSAIREVDRNRILGWQQQRIVIRRMTVTAALAEYSRYGGTRFVLEAASLADRQISGSFRMGDEGAFIGALERGLPIRAERTGSGVMLKLREPNRGLQVRGDGSGK